MSYLKNDEQIIVKAVLTHPVMGELINSTQEPPFKNMIESILQSTENEKTTTILPSIKLIGRNGNYFGRTIKQDESVITVCMAIGNTSVLLKSKTNENIKQVKIYWELDILYEFIDYLIKVANFWNIKVDTPYPYAYSEEITVEEKGIQRSIFLTPQYLRLECFTNIIQDELWTRINLNQVNIVLKIVTSYLFNHNEFNQSVVYGNRILEQLYENWRIMKGIK